jgi:septal ring factor EnvC (AmiA/AmiB activator)
MSTAPAALIDNLNSLLDAERTSLFRFMSEGYPYLNRASVEVRLPLQEMVRTIDNRVDRLAALIESLGGVADSSPRGIDREEQYLAFLSLKFLLPKLLDAKKMLIERYENALKSLPTNKEGAAETKILLTSLLGEHRAQLKTLTEAASRVATQK